MGDKIKKYDFNNDGKPDRIVTTRRGEMISSHGEITRPDGTPMKLDKYDACYEKFKDDPNMWKKGMAWFVDDPKILFYGSNGKLGFAAGEKVMHDGEVKEIKGFRLMVNGLNENDSHAVVIFDNCEWAELDELKKIK